MCDTLCARQPDRTLFAKNSDRPPAEVQLIEAHGRRRSGDRLRTQYLELADQPAWAVLGARPVWLWGFEHGLNEHQVAIGNERVWTVDDASQARPALIGMDLVRLGLERSATAEEALEVITALLAEHGQGGIADRDHGEAYFSSFLIADPHAAWILETSGRTWAARPVAGGASISNRLSLSTDWTRSSPDVAPGADFDDWRDPTISTGHADDRLAATSAAVVARSELVGPREVAAALRHHGTRPWGAPGATDAVELPDTQQVTVCMHLPGYNTTTSAIIAELHRDPEAPHRAWVAPGSPCVSVFVPIFPTAGTVAALATEAVWRRFAALRDRVDAQPTELLAVREVLGPLEAELWDEADEVAGDPLREAPFLDAAWARVDTALRTLAA
jgi:secernin